MRNPFRKRRDERDAPADWSGKLQELDARFARLEEALAQIKDKLPQVIIEHVVIDRPVLEKLEFRLDGLDIEHLSGSLNLGNNFGLKPSVRDGSGRDETDRRQAESRRPRPGRGPASGGASSQAGSASEAAPASPPGLHRTPTGFRLNNRR